MKKVIREVKGDIIQCTIADERWYILPDGRHLPSVTWIAGHYPKGTEFYKWLASKGWDEAQAVKVAAGDKGSKVHHAIEDILDGKTVPIEAKYYNSTTEEEEELTLEECQCLKSFNLWLDDHQPRVIDKEVLVVNEKGGYAGTVDLIAVVGNQTWIIDFKTGQYIWPEYELQLSAYKWAASIKDVQRQEICMGILQVGYKKNQRGWKFTEIQDKYDLFLAAKKIWANENGKMKPTMLTFPTEFKWNKREILKPSPVQSAKTKGKSPPPAGLQTKSVKSGKSSTQKVPA